jgi:hypothetical protein
VISNIQFLQYIRLTYNYGLRDGNPAKKIFARAVEKNGQKSTKKELTTNHPHPKEGKMKKRYLEMIKDLSTELARSEGKIQNLQYEKSSLERIVATGKEENKRQYDRLVEGDNRLASRDKEILSLRIGIRTQLDNFEQVQDELACLKTELRRTVRGREILKMHEGR